MNCEIALIHKLCCIVAYIIGILTLLATATLPVILVIIKARMTSFAIAVYGQCCRRHVVGQQVVSDVSAVIVVKVFVVCLLNIQ